MVRWYKMQRSLVRLLACLFALLMGSIGVLFSMKILVVPRYDDFSQSWRRTRCYIKNITFSTQYIHQIPPQAQLSGKGSVYIHHPHPSPVSCVHVFVDYVSKDNTLKETYLQEKTVLTHEQRGNICRGSKHVSILLPYSFQIFWGFHQNSECSKKFLLWLQCFCCGCSSQNGGSHVTSLSFENEKSGISTIRIGDPVDCYQGNWTKVALATKSGYGRSAWTSLRIILWPTIIFVAGFVGSFFSFIEWFEEVQWKMNRPISYDIRMENISTRETALWHMTCQHIENHWPSTDWLIIVMNLFCTTRCGALYSFCIAAQRCCCKFIYPWKCSSANHFQSRTVMA